MIGPIEKELTRRYFEARNRLAEYKEEEEKEREYLRGQAEALLEAARYAEGLES